MHVDAPATTIASKRGKSMQALAAERLCPANRRVDDSRRLCPCFERVLPYRERRAPCTLTPRQPRLRRREAKACKRLPPNAFVLRIAASMIRAGFVPALSEASRIGSG